MVALLALPPPLVPLSTSPPAPNSTATPLLAVTAPLLVTVPLAPVMMTPPAPPAIDRPDAFDALPPLPMATALPAVADTVPEFVTVPEPSIDTPAAPMIVAPGAFVTCPFCATTMPPIFVPVIEPPLLTVVLPAGAQTP